MLLVYGMPATLLRSWGHNTTKPETESTSITNPASEESIQYTDSRANFDEYTTKTSESGCRTPASASSDDFDSTSGAALHYNTPTTPTVGDTTSVSKLYQLDTTTFPFHAVHLMPSEPNGTWNTQVIYAVTNSSRSAPTLREVYQEQMPKLDVPTLVRKLTQIAENTKEDLEGWLNKTLANQDLGEIHNRLLHLVAGPSMPNIRQIDEVIDAVTETMQLLQKKSSDSELLEKFRHDKHLFAEVVCRKAQRALIEQGICKEWQLQCNRNVHLKHDMQAALLHTFSRVKLLRNSVPLFRAQPQWVAERETKTWRLELDVGVVGIEVGPATDRSLIELGFIDTGFQLPESCGCASITDIDRQAQDVEDEWQLLEA